MQNKKIVYIVIGVLVLVGVFYGGLFYGKNNSPKKEFGNFDINNMQNRNGQFGMGGNMNNRNNRNGENFIIGEIISKDEKGATIKLLDGGSKIVLFDTNTTVSKMATGSTTDLTNGVSVSINGTTNADGSVTAKSIQIRPEMRQGRKTQ